MYNNIMLTVTVGKKVTSIVIIGNGKCINEPSLRMILVIGDVNCRLPNLITS